MKIKVLLLILRLALKIWILFVFHATCYKFRFYICEQCINLTKLKFSVYLIEMQKNEMTQVTIFRKILFYFHETLYIRIKLTGKLHLYEQQRKKLISV